MVLNLWSLPNSVSLAELIKSLNTRFCVSNGRDDHLLIFPAINAAKILAKFDLKELIQIT